MCHFKKIANRDLSGQNYLNPEFSNEKAKIKEYKSLNMRREIKSHKRNISKMRFSYSKEIKFQKYMQL